MNSSLKKPIVLCGRYRTSSHQHGNFASTMRQAGERGLSGPGEQLTATDLGMCKLFYNP